MKPPLAVAIVLAVAVQAGLSFANADVAAAKPVGLGSARAVLGVGAPVQSHPALVPVLAPSDGAVIVLPHALAPSGAGIALPHALAPSGGADMRRHTEPWANSPAVRANAFYVHDLRSPINAADLFQPPESLLPYVLITTRIAGAATLPITEEFTQTVAFVISEMYCANFNITVDLLQIYPSKSANLTSSTGPAERNVTSDPRFRNFDSADVQLQLSIGIDSSLPAWGSTMREFSLTLQRGMAAKGYDVRFLAHIWTRLQPSVIPIMSNIPPMVSQGFRFVVKLTGYGLFPFNVQKQTLFSEVIFQLVVTRTGLYEVTLLRITEAAGENGDPDLVSIDMCMAQAGGVGHLDQIIQWVFNNGDTSALAGAASLGGTSTTNGGTSTTNGRKVLAAQTTAFYQAMANSGLPILTANLTEMRPTHNATFAQQLNNVLAPPVIEAVTAGTQQGPSILTIALSTAFGVVVFCLILGGGLVLLRYKTPKPAVDLEMAGNGKGTPGRIRETRLSDDSAGEHYSRSLDSRGKGGSGKQNPSSLASEALADHVRRNGLSGPPSEASSGPERGPERFIPVPAASKDSDNLMQRRSNDARGWELDPSDITICTLPDGSDWLLGKGGGGMVFKGLRCGVQDVAVKIMLQVSASDQKQFKKEVAILKSLSFDKNVVQFYGCMDGPCPLLILEYMEGGDLWDALDEHRDKMQWYVNGRSLALDVARGLHFLHHNKVRHGDLKTKNILLTGDLKTAKIGDVGMAKVMHSATTNRAEGGTFAYAAPELLFNQRCDEKADIYSFGVVMWELCTLDRPERGGMRPVKVPEEAPEEIAALIQRCMATSPERRPTAREVFDIIRGTVVARCGSGECESVAESLRPHSSLGSPTSSLPAASPPNSLQNSVVFAELSTILGCVREECETPSYDSGAAVQADVEGPAPDSFPCAPKSSFAVPSSDGTTPSTTLAAPARDGATPSSTLATPARDGTTPSSTLAAPAHDGTTPSSTLAAPARDGTTSSSTLAAPANDGTTPSSTLAAPASGASPSGVSVNGAAHAPATIAPRVLRVQNSDEGTLELDNIDCEAFQDWLVQRQASVRTKAPVSLDRWWPKEEGPPTK